ncbi:hypothetical protein C8R45DRAFT_1083150 [Mycena sanguinolenta]|nr:hypothetical protein C8R45DRAFT_1083150 [Mycena sanguinolenta]
MPDEASRENQHSISAHWLITSRNCCPGLEFLSVSRLQFICPPSKAEWLLLRLCRLCRGAVEDEAHALFGCAVEPRLVQLRAEFLAGLATKDPETRRSYGTAPDYDFLLAVISSRKSVAILAKFVYVTRQIFHETPPYIPLAFRTSV